MNECNTFPKFPPHLSDWHKTLLYLFGDVYNCKSNLHFLRTIAVCLFSGVCLQRSSTCMSPLFHPFVKHHRFAHSLVVNPAEEVFIRGAGRSNSRESPAFAHTAPLENVGRLPEVRCTSESSQLHLWVVSVECLVCTVAPSERFHWNPLPAGAGNEADGSGEPFH